MLRRSVTALDTVVGVGARDAWREGPSPELVTRLLSAQAPHLAGQPVVPSANSGSSNWVFRLGEEYAVRLPRSASYVGDLRKEATWLPRLGPELPVPVPRIVVEGEASPLFEWPWTVVTWIPGELPSDQDGPEQARLASTLGRFVQRLHAVDTGDLPAGAQRWGYRCGEPVTDEIDGWADSAADDVADLFDPSQVREAWRRLRDVPPASEPPCWVHTDLSAENLLVRPGGSLVGVIDFGGLGIGDRSIDLLYAWSLFDQPARAVFRTASGVDDATWLRARAWAFVGPGLCTIADYRTSMPERTARLTTMVEAVAAEVGVSLR